MYLIKGRISVNSGIHLYTSYEVICLVQQVRVGGLIISNFQHTRSMYQIFYRKMVTLNGFNGFIIVGKKSFKTLWGKGENTGNYNVFSFSHNVFYTLETNPSFQSIFLRCLQMLSIFTCLKFYHWVKRLRDTLKKKYRVLIYYVPER